MEDCSWTIAACCRAGSLLGCSLLLLVTLTGCCRRPGEAEHVCRSEEGGQQDHVEGRGLALLGPGALAVPPPFKLTKDVAFGATGLLAAGGGLLAVDSWLCHVLIAQPLLRNSSKGIDCVKCAR